MMVMKLIVGGLFVVGLVAMVGCTTGNEGKHYDVPAVPGQSAEESERIAKLTKFECETKVRASIQPGPSYIIYFRSEVERCMTLHGYKIVD